MTNEELVIAFQKNEVPFEVVYEQCQRLVHKEANRWVLRGYDRGDVENLAIYAFYEACQRYDSTRNILVSTHSTTHIRYRLSEVYNRLKLEKYGGTSVFLSCDHKMTTKDRRAFEAGLIQAGIPADQAVMAKTLEQQAKRVLEQLPEPTQTYAFLFYFDGWTKSEIAKAYDRLPQNIQYHLNQAKKRLSDQLKDWK